jgi:hypothetical protein
MKFEPLTLGPLRSTLDGLAQNTHRLRIPSAPQEVITRNAECKRPH